MQKILVTIITISKNIDLELPGDIPISTLMPALVDICVQPPQISASIDPSTWQLRIAGTVRPLVSDYSLIDVGVKHSSVLLLENTHISGQSLDDTVPNQPKIEPSKHVKKGFFYRPARSYPSVLPTNEIVISTPPVLQNKTGVVGYLQYLLPIIGVMMSLIIVFAYRENFTMIFTGLVLAIGGIGVGITIGIVQRHLRKKKREWEQQIYQEYLANHRTQLKELADEQRKVSIRLYPDYEDLAVLLEQQTYLWERRPKDSDFLMVRIGVGPVPISCHISLDLNNDVMVQYIPDLLLQAQTLVIEHNYLEDMPVVISLHSIGVLAVHGNRSDARALVRALLCHIVAFQSPEDVRCMAYFPEDDAFEWSWLKWLPHVRPLHHMKVEQPYGSEYLCMLATSVEDVKNLISQQIKPELDRRYRLSEDKSKLQDARITQPHLFVILDDFSLFNTIGQLPELDVIFRDAEKFGITVICIVDDPSQEPLQVQARLSIASKRIFDIVVADYEEMRHGGQRLEAIIPDAVDPKMCERIARCMAPLSLAKAGTQLDLSQDIRLMQLLNIPASGTFDIAETWQPRKREALLKVPVGLRGDGGPLMLDFKEAAEKGMGPHGLIVGATGSGKSELLRTIIISLAVTHDPQTVRFVLIDFKGGASFADFIALPHVAGIITNLQSDTSLVDRVYSSLLGEQQRRQRILRAAGNLNNIKEYQAKWQRNPEMEPMPYLLIIVDEFAELLANRPDFLDLFITMGRIGRSLGLHLLFATQRLEEGRIRGLEGLLRYRICLRTFSAGESNAVLGTSDAYYLPSTPGAGYFKVDTDTYHLFKAALISAPYVSDQEQIFSQINEFTSTGKLVKYQPQTSGLSSLTIGRLKESELSNLHTEMDVIIDHLSHALLPQSYRPFHQVWLPPLPKLLLLNTILQTHHQELDGHLWSKQPPFGILRIPLGLLDMPLQQAQEPFILDFSGSGGHLALVGAPQSGKSMFLRTLVTSFILTHSPRDVQIYCIDLGGGLLRVFEQSPHVGAVCGKSDRDKLRRMIRQIRKVIEDREYLYREHGIDSMATFRARRQAGEIADFPFGDVFLVIDNFTQFVQEFDMEAEITELVSSGLTYGVHVVIVANRWAEIRIKLRDNISTRLELRLNDPVDSEFGKAAAAAVPIDAPGRGINQEKLQFHIALPIVDQRKDGELPPIQHALEAFIQRVKQHWDGPIAPPVRMLPSLVRWTEMPSLTTETNLPAGVPLGLEELRLDPIFIDLISGGPHFLVLGDVECGKTTLLRTWMRGIEQRYDKQEVSFAIIDYRRTLVDFAESKHLLTYAYNAATLATCVESLKAELDRRMTFSDDIPLTQLEIPGYWAGRHYFLFVDDYDSLISANSSPLNPLVKYLFAGRDIGFHVVIVRRVGGIGRAAFEPMFQRLREMETSAIIMSGDPQEGRILYGQVPMLQPPGRGYFVRRNQPTTLVQIAFAEPEYTKSVSRRNEPFVEAANPYVVGKPVEGNLFVGRDDILKMIYNNIQPGASKNVLVLRGQRRSGKTSVLLRLRDKLTEESNSSYIPVFFDLEGVSSIKNEGQFLYALADRIRLDLSDQGIQTPSPKLSEFEHAPTITFKSDFLYPITDTLGSKRKILLMLDEFEITKSLIDKKFLSYDLLRYCRHLMQHTPLLFLIAGTHKLRELTDGYWSTFFNLAVPIDIGTLPISATTSLITEPVKQWYTLTPPAIDKIIHISGCHPYFVQMVCMHLLDIRNEQQLNTVGNREVDIAINRTLEKGDMMVGYPWTEQDCTADERFILSVLAREGIDTAPVSIETIRRQLKNLLADSMVDSAVDRLIERQVVKLNDVNSTLSFVVPLFGNWVMNKRYYTIAGVLRYNEEHVVSTY